MDPNELIYIILLLKLWSKIYIPELEGNCTQRFELWKDYKCNNPSCPKLLRSWFLLEGFYRCLRDSIYQFHGQWSRSHGTPLGLHIPKMPTAHWCSHLALASSSWGTLDRCSSFSCPISLRATAVWAEKYEKNYNLIEFFWYDYNLIE